jgi:hypothetical protein
MAKVHLHPYRAPDEIAGTVDRLHKEPSPLVHPQRVLESMRKERPQISQINGWLADHIVGLAGTMAFFYFLCLVLGAWTVWQSAIQPVRVPLFRPGRDHAVAICSDYAYGFQPNG